MTTDSLPKQIPAELPRQKNELTSPLTLILFLIIVALVGSGVVYIFQERKLDELRYKVSSLPLKPAQSSTNPEITPTPVPESWTDYTSKEFGFTISIPSSVSTDKIINDKYNRFVSFNDGRGGFDIMLRPVQGKKFDLNSYMFMDLAPDHKTTVSGKEVNVYISETGYCDGPGCSKPFVTYAFINGNEIYHISFFDRTVPNETDQRIIDSFKLNFSK